MGLRTVARIVIVLVAVLVTCGRLAIADTNYFRTVELPPLRASFTDLQATLDKVSSLVNAANKDSSIWQETLQLRKEEQRVLMLGHRLEPEGAKIPPLSIRLNTLGAPARRLLRSLRWP
jgi:hypothetical protein